MKKSKLAIVSFVLSLIPIVIPILLVLQTLIFSRPPGATAKIGRVVALFGITFFYTTFVTFWLAILSIILGIAALIKIKKNNLEGRWFAIVGMILSVITVIMLVIFSFMIGWEAVVGYG